MKVLKILSTVFTSVCAVVFAVFFAGYFITDNYSAAINMYFHAETSKYVNVGEGTVDTEYFKSDYAFMTDKKVVNSDGSFSYENAGEELFQEDAKIIEEVVGEGVTLLWNENNALPISKSSSVSLLGRYSKGLVETGTGSGYIASSSRSANLKSGLEAEGVTVNPTLWNFYNGNRTSDEDCGSSCGENHTIAVNEPAWSTYNATVLNSFSQYGDAAIVVIGRTGGEYSDLDTHSADAGVGGNYLALTPNEITLLDKVKEYKQNGTFKKVILLINSGNPIEFGVLQNYMDVIDAGMWIGEPGTTGANAVARVLTGTVNPSGHLPDTFAVNLKSAPATVNNGDFKYSNYTSFKDGNNITLKERQGEYLVYQEGIYVGYKYYETRYEDLVMGKGNADNAKGVTSGGTAWDYDEEVMFPFGHGLSYTTFEYSGFDVIKRGSDYEVTVTVKNTGTVAGKDAVEIYMQKPYTDFDKNNGLEQSAVQLCGYAKTPVIEPGKSEKITVTVDELELRTYDNQVNRTYILEEGYYYFTVGENSHDAINNILAAKGYNVGGVKALADRKEIKTTDTETYSVSPYNPEVKITNQLDKGDINKYYDDGEEYVKYLTRNDWTTYPTEYAKLAMTAQLALDMTYDKAFEEDESLEPIEYPVYDTDEINNPFKLVMGLDASVVGYDHELWDKLLDQMTWEEQAELCAYAYHAAPAAGSIAMPSLNMENGPVGITKRSDFPMPKGKDFINIGYPCGPLMGATFNDELIERLGMHMSEDMLYTGYQGIYGPGLNLHRSPYGGRNWEYPSEDSFLAGMIGSAECRGIESKGCMAYAKHFALNDTETNRRHASIWSSEQATREIYLSVFEKAFTEGGASATMNSFTRVGAEWTGACSALQKNILRDEWDWKGINISDWDQGDGFMSKIDGLLNGTDSFDGNSHGSVFNQWKDSPTVQYALRESAKHIIYNAAHTNAMNGLDSDTIVVPITPWWQKAIITACWVTGSLTVVFGLATAGLFVADAMRKKRSSSL